MELMQHQRQAVEIARLSPRFLFGDDCGSGKTIGALSICADQPMRSLVLAPKTILRSAWVGDSVHFPHLKIEVVTGTAGQQTATVEDSQADIFVTNFEAFRKHWRLYLAVGVRRLIVDEASKLKNHESQISQTVFRFAWDPQIQQVFCLSGTPAPNSDVEYFPQLRCFDPDIKRLPFFTFAYRYFTPRKKRIYKGGKPRDVIEGWTPRKDREDEFKALLRKWSRVVRKIDCMDLPEQTDRVILVDLSEEEAEAYRSAVEDLRIRGTRINAEASTIKLRQIVNGTVRLEGASEEIGSSKLDALAEVLEEIGPREPVVIWCEFTADIDRIKQMLPGSVVLDGRTSMLAGEIAADFQAGKTKRLICHPAAAGHGITLTAASHAIYFGVGWSYEIQKQSRDRIHRKGQKMPCTYHYLLASGTLEEKMLEVVRGKGTAAEALRDLLAEG